MNLQELRDRRRAVEAVRGVVSAMRATAAGRIQAAQRAMAAARQYRDVVLRALAVTGPLANYQVSPPVSNSRLLIVFASEQPLCGAYNHAMIDLAVAAVREWNSAKLTVVAVGQRGSRVMAARGLTPDHVEVGSTSLPGLHSVVRRLAARVDHGFVSGQFAAVDVVYSRFRSVSEQVPELAPILPLGPAAVPTPHPPLTAARYLPDPQLIAGLVSQYAYISLYRAAAESYACEQASRLLAMDGATRNTERMADDLLGLERRERQQEVTRQVLELAAARFANHSSYIEK